jgi:hypothetical protein
MAAFTLDTSGTVIRLSQLQPDLPVGVWRWSDLTPFEQGYIEALFASIADLGPDFWANDDKAGYPDFNFGILSPSALDLIRRDCERGQMHYTASDEFEGGEFWRDRQRGIFKILPPLTVSLGDDGKVYLREAA